MTTLFVYKVFEQIVVIYLCKDYSGIHLAFSTLINLKRTKSLSIPMSLVSLKHSPVIFLKLGHMLIYCIQNALVSINHSHIQIYQHTVQVRKYWNPPLRRHAKI